MRQPSRVPLLCAQSLPAGDDALGCNGDLGRREPSIHSRRRRPRQTEITSATALSLTNGNWYTAKLTVDDDGSGGDRLRFWVDTDGDSTWSDETEHFNDTSVIDDWPAGYVGLYVAGTGAPTEFDDVTMWMDTDADGTIDEQQFADDFDSNQVTLTYDDNGNLTYDGVFTRLAPCGLSTAHPLNAFTATSAPTDALCL